jgi:hypothetical protein
MIGIFIKLKLLRDLTEGRENRRQETNQKKSMRIWKENIKRDPIKTEKKPVADSCVHGQEVPDCRKSEELLHEFERLSFVKLLKGLTAGKN